MTLSCFAVTGVVHAAADVDPAAVARQAVVILENHCWKCHGPNKQKGKLRLDSAEALAKGGENGPVITPDKPDESPLVLAIKRIDPDESMPPKAKDALTPEQVAVLVAWVQAGTPWPAAVTSETSSEPKPK